MKTPWLVTLPLLVLTALMALTYQNCAGFRTPQSTTSSSVLQCRPQGAGTFSEAKMQVTSSFIRNKAINSKDLHFYYPAEEGRVQKLSAKTPPIATLTQEEKNRARLPQGTELVAVVDVACALQAQMRGHRPSNYPLSYLFDPEVLRDKMVTFSPSPKNEFALPFKLPSETLLSQVDEWAKTDKCVIGVTNNGRIYKKALDNITDSGFSKQHFHSAIQSQSAWPLFYDTNSGINQDITVAVIDTGVYQQQTDFNNPGSLFSGFSHTFTARSPANALEGNPAQYPDGTYSYHGTHVGGLIAAPANGMGVVGSAPERVKLMTLNVFQFEPVTNSQGFTTYSEFADASDVYNAIKWATDNNAQLINMSLGSIIPANQCPSTLYVQGIIYAANQNVPILAAAGNGYTACDIATSGQSCDPNQYSTTDMNSSTSPRNYPAYFAKDYSNVIAVGSTDDAPASSTQKSNFSDYGTTVVEISAPGSSRYSDSSSGILSTMSPQEAPNNTNSVYGFLQGTSMATPIMTGAAALAYGLYQRRVGHKPSATLFKQMITDPTAVDQVPALQSYFKNGARLNMLKLAQSISQKYPLGGPVPTATPIPQITPTPTPSASVPTPTPTPDDPIVSDLPPCAQVNAVPICQ